MKNLEVITDSMRLVGFQLLESESAAMDSGTALYSNGTKRIQIVKDKGQWTLDESRQKIESCGLWKAFDDTLEFQRR